MLRPGASTRDLRPFSDASLVTEYTANAQRHAPSDLHSHRPGGGPKCMERLGTCNPAGAGFIRYCRRTCSGRLGHTCVVRIRAARWPTFTPTIDHAAANYRSHSHRFVHGTAKEVVPHASKSRPILCLLLRAKEAQDMQVHQWGWGVAARSSSLQKTPAIPQPDAAAGRTTSAIKSRH